MKDSLTCRERVLSINWFGLLMVFSNKDAGRGRQIREEDYTDGRS